MQRQTELLFARCEPTLKAAVQELATETGQDISKTVRAAVLDYLRHRHRWPLVEQERLGKAA